MSVLVDAGTKVVVQGITGHQGTVHTRQMKLFGTAVVAGVTPGKGGTTVEETPVFDSVRDAVDRTGANASCIFVPAPFAKDALLESVDAGIRLAVIVTEHIPFHDMLVMYHYARSRGARSSDRTVRGSRPRGPPRSASRRTSPSGPAGSGSSRAAGP
ncbi:succinyl-CoA synthetase, alpha subunit [mine drainage metagenome]|uniref:Succinyl-CoA synthetase, alpha subunit n=1 Tax=mine drainage metagenome TaxID=410659 RepID=T1BGC9_9ZZZZ